jgi:alcohol dehydrogenase, propanol-preferring
MKAMVLNQQGKPLDYQNVPDPMPKEGQVLLRVLSCGVCRTDLHIIDGELKNPKKSLILGHEIVGEVIGLGANANEFSIGDRVGVPWLGWTCGKCYFCQTERENLCEKALFTGYQLDGGFAEMTVADQRYCFLIGESYSDVDAAPLLCAGLIGYRALKLSDDGQKLGIYGFGAAAHIVAQIAIHEGSEVYAFTQEGDTKTQGFARKLGAIWAGSSKDLPPNKLDAAIIFAPVGALVPLALEATAKGATVVCAGIHMSDIPSIPYSLLWGERVIKSVANLTRADGLAFMSLAPLIPVKTNCTVYPLSHANEALEDLRSGKFNGAAVLVPSIT